MTQSPKSKFSWQPAINDHNSTVEPYSLVMMNGQETSSGKLVHRIVELASPTKGRFAATSEFAIEAGKRGEICHGPTALIRYTGTVASGDLVGKSSTDDFAVATEALPLVGIVIAIANATSKIALVKFQVAFPSRYIKAPSGGIPARAANLLGKATCDVWWRNGQSQTTYDSTINIDVLNWGVSAACATGDRMGWVDYGDDAWFIVSEDCADTGTSGAMSLTGGSPVEGDGDTGLSDSGDSGLMIISGQQPVTGDMATWGTSGEAPPILP